MTTPLASRLSKAMAAMDPVPTQADLARAAGVRPPSVSDWFSGKTKTLGKALLPVARFLNVNPEWLSAGKGAMHGQVAGSVSQAPRPDFGRISAAIIVLRTYLDLVGSPAEDVADEVLLEIAYEVVLEFGGEEPAANILDLTKILAKRMREAQGDREQVRGAGKAASG